MEQNEISKSLNILGNLKLLKPETKEEFNFSSVWEDLAQEQLLYIMFFNRWG